MRARYTIQNGIHIVTIAGCQSSSDFGVSLKGVQLVGAETQERGSQKAINPACESAKGRSGGVIKSQKRIAWMLR
jgi:hypothetical protein